MEMLVTRFMATIDWEAANGFELTEQIKVLIAAQASMLLLGLGLDGYDDVTSVIVHPANVPPPLGRLPRSLTFAGWTMTEVTSSIRQTWGCAASG